MCALIAIRARRASARPCVPRLGAGAGKTSVASCVEGVKPSVQHEPTSGFNCRNARVAPHWQLDLWDLGGSALIRQYWSRYLTADTKILLFVVDAADRARFAEARAALDGALAATDELPALLVLANKQDLPGAATTAEVSDALGIAAGASATRAAVLPISCARAAAAGADAQSASGLSDVLAWVSSALQSISHVDDE